MGRPRVRSAVLAHDVISQIKNLFGTVKNAHELLGLQIDVPYSAFYIAMQFRDITPKHKELIEARWQAWRTFYLKPECPSSDDFRLNPMDITLEPEWYVTPKSQRTARSRSSRG